MGALWALWYPWGQKTLAALVCELEAGGWRLWGANKETEGGRALLDTVCLSPLES